MGARDSVGNTVSFIKMGMVHPLTKQVYNVSLYASNFREA